MSQPIQQPYQVPPQPPRQPVVRLPTWVNVVLVLILLASCGANNRDDVSSEQVANQVVAQLDSRNDDGLDVPASSADVEDLCRLLGALAAKEKVPLTVMDQNQLTQCHQLAQEAATAATP
jgi:hypothetical protein